MESYYKGDLDRGRNHPDVQSLITAAHDALGHHAAREWMERYPALFGGMEEVFKILEQHLHSGPTTLPTLPSSTPGGTETSAESSKVSKQQSPLPAIQNAPVHDTAGPASKKQSPDVLPSQTKPAAPSTPSATPSRTAHKTPAPRPVMRSGSSAFPGKLHRTAPTASADVKTPSVIKKDVEKMPPPTQIIVKVCFI